MLKKIANTLYPTGSAFSVKKGSSRESLHNSIDYTLNGYFNVKDSFLNGLYPDNENITEQEVEFLSYIYGLDYPSGLDFQQKKELLLEKINNSKATNHKQSAIYIEKILNDYGFDVMVTENLNWDIPSDLMTVKQVQHGFNIQHGFGIQMGMESLPVIANSQNPNEPYFYHSNNSWATFFITGKNGLDEDIPVSNEDIVYFRQLVLRLKPAHVVAILKTSYIISSSPDFNNDFNNDFNTL